MRSSWKLLLAAFVFALCVAPSIVSYSPYFFAWDDSDYLGRSIKVSRAFWSGNKTELRDAMVSIRPPMMTLLGVPWGPLTSWDAAGKQFVTLNTIVSFFAACCLFLLLRSGIKPWSLLIPCVCLLAALGPFPPTAGLHSQATALMADSLFSWIALAALLLIPFEAAAHSRLTRDAVLRGILWGIIMTAGVMTKASFLYFLVLTLPILFALRMLCSGVRSALIAAGAFAITCAPIAFYWLRYGLAALKNGWAASFGQDASFYYSPLSIFLMNLVRDSPGVSLLVLVVASSVVYCIVNRRNIRYGTIVLPLLIILGYLAIGFATSNREIRFLLPGIVALPFLIGSLIFPRDEAAPWRLSALSALLAFCGLTAAGIPMLHRQTRESFLRSEAVLALAVESNAKHVLLATDSPTLNASLMSVATALSQPNPSLHMDELSWRIAAGEPIEEDLRIIQGSDLVVFQDEQELTPPFTNRGFSEHMEYTKQHAVDGPLKVANDVSVYRLRHDSN